MLHIAILHTIKGGKYASLIARELSKFNVKVSMSAWTDFIPLISTYEFPDWDLIHVRFGGLGASLMLLKALSEYGYRMVNSAWCVEHSTNKFLGTIIANRKAGVKTPKTFLVDRRFNLDILKNLEYPLIAKPLMSHQGRLVAKINSFQSLKNYLNSHNENPIILQEFINFVKLIRTVVVGDEIIDAAYDVPKEGWRASVCLNPNVKKYSMTPELKEFCYKVAEAFGGEILVIDVFETNEGYFFNEINNACNLYPMQLATGVNHAKSFANYLYKKAKR